MRALCSMLGVGVTNERTMKPLKVDVHIKLAPLGIGYGLLENVLNCINTLSQSMLLLYLEPHRLVWPFLTLQTHINAPRANQSMILALQI